MSRADFFLWIALPYLCIAVFVVGHVWRWRTDQLHWGARSTQLLESRLLRWGSPLFHFGILAVIGGHVLGLLIPESWTHAVGITEDGYHVLAVVGGGTAAAATIAGLVILVYRRTANARVRATTSKADMAVYLMLFVVILSGTWAVLGENLVLGTYEYRLTVSPWFRGIFQFSPDANFMNGAPFIYQLHAVSAFLLIALWPFTRLVHAWSAPVTYPMRRPIIYRSRTAARGMSALRARGKGSTEVRR